MTRTRGSGSAAVITAVAAVVSAAALAGCQRQPGAETRSPPAGDTLDARRREVPPIEGEVPHVGTLLDRAGALWLATPGDTLQLSAVPDALKPQAGATVWVVGRRTAEGLELRSYRIIDDR